MNYRDKLVVCARWRAQYAPLLTSFILARNTILFDHLSRALSLIIQNFFFIGGGGPLFPKKQREAGE